MYSIITTANARRDIRDAIDREDRRSEGLGQRFHYFLVLKLQLLSTTPLIGSVGYFNIRCTTTDVFPYLIHYTIDEAAHTIIILRLLHTKREPAW